MPLSHGEFEVCLEYNVITAKAIGAFNYECVLNYTNEIKLFVTHLKEKAFCMIIDNSKFEGCTPEGFVVLDDFNSWLNSSELKAKAFIINSEVNKQIILDRTPSLSFQNIQFFSDHKEANQWVRNFL
jgi:hypothetical protein